jgi:hypothetical protein
VLYLESFKIRSRRKTRKMRKSKPGKNMCT